MNTEEAYQYLAEEMIAFAGNAPWTSLIAETIVYKLSSNAKHWVVNANNKTRSLNMPPNSITDKASDARFFLRDELLKTTGHLCYGFNFSLFKDGQFDIQYRYDNPYKDIEEQIAAEQRNKGNT